MKGYRTLLANILMAAIPVIEAANLANVLPDGWLPWYALGMVAANITLRLITTTPVGQKGSADPSICPDCKGTGEYAAWGGTCPRCGGDPDYSGAA